VATRPATTRILTTTALAPNRTLREGSLGPDGRMKAEVSRDRLELLMHAFEEAGGEEMRDFAAHVPRVHVDAAGLRGTALN
jgi:hypothetical protein